MQTSAGTIWRAAKEGKQGTNAVLRRDAPAPSGAKSVLDEPSTGLFLVLAGLAFVGHMLVAGNDGYFRDELYYIANGRHLQAGYIDQPLLIGLLAAFMRFVAGDGLVAIHVIPALACALLVVMTGLVARELRGGRVAQLAAGALPSHRTRLNAPLHVLRVIRANAADLRAVRVSMSDLPATVVHGQAVRLNIADGTGEGLTQLVPPSLLASS